MEKQQLIICPNCGERGENLFRTKEGDLICGRCGHRWRDNDLKKEEISSLITKVLGDSEATALEHAIKNLAKAVRDGADEDVKTFSREVCRYNPDDFSANFYLTFLGGDPRKLNTFLEKSVPSEEMLPPVLQFALPRIEVKSGDALKTFLYRLGTVSPAFREKWVGKIEEELKRVKAGMYDPTLPRDVFIAHSSKDAALVNDLVDYLEEDGSVTCFVSSRNVRQVTDGVTHYWQILQTAMKHCKGVVFVSTPNSCSSECEAVCGRGDRQGELPWLKENFPEKFCFEYIPRGTRQASDRRAKAILEAIFAGQEPVYSKERVLQEIVWQSEGITKPKSAPKPVETKKTEGPTDAEAQFKLGKKYYDEKNYAEAVKWYRKAAEQGNAGAQNNLGNCYYCGRGVSQDYAEAVKWYRKSAEQGNADAQFNLGDCYEHGRGVSQDYAEAVKWYRKSAEQGDATAQSHLGYCYENGYGVPQDRKEAIKWYKKAAEQGSQYAIAALKRLGETV